MLSREIPEPAIVRWRRQGRKAIRHPRAPRGLGFFEAPAKGLPNAKADEFRANWASPIPCPPRNVTVPQLQLQTGHATLSPSGQAARNVLMRLARKPGAKAAAIAPPGLGLVLVKIKGSIAAPEKGQGAR